MHGLKDDGTKIDDRYCIICGRLVQNWYDEYDDDCRKDRNNMVVLCNDHKHIPLQEILTAKEKYLDELNEIDKRYPV